VENVRENISGQLSGMSVVQGLVVQVSILAEPPPKQLLLPLGQRDHYLLGETHSLTQKLPTSFPLFSFSLIYSYFTTRSPSLETETCVVFWSACVKKMEVEGGYL